MPDSYHEDPDPRATIPIVSGSNFAQYAIGRPAEEPVAPTPARSRRRVFAVAGWVALILVVGAGAAWIAYAVTGPR